MANSGARWLDFCPKKSCPADPKDQMVRMFVFHPVHGESDGWAKKPKGNSRTGNPSEWVVLCGTKNFQKFTFRV
jgi:hypothetical protein